MRRPAVGARYTAAVEARGVVGRHRRVVTASVRLDEAQAPDRKARAVEPAEDGDDALCRGRVDDERAGMPLPVEAPVADVEPAELRRADGTTWSPRMLEFGGRRLRDPSLEPGRRRRRQGEEPGQTDREKLHRHSLAAR